MEIVFKNFRLKTRVLPNKCLAIDAPLGGYLFVERKKQQTLPRQGATLSEWVTLTTAPSNNHTPARPSNRAGVCC